MLCFIDFYWVFNGWPLSFQRVLTGFFFDRFHFYWCIAYRGFFPSTFYDTRFFCFGFYRMGEEKKMKDGGKRRHLICISFASHLHTAATAEASWRHRNRPTPGRPVSVSVPFFFCCWFKFVLFFFYRVLPSFFFLRKNRRKGLRRVPPFPTVSVSRLFFLFFSFLFFFFVFLLRFRSPFHRMRHRLVPFQAVSINYQLSPPKQGNTQ